MPRAHKIPVKSSSEILSPGQYSFELLLRGQFVATENFFYVRSDLKLPLDGDIVAMKEAAKTTCEMRLDELGTSDSSKQKHCFGLSFQAALLDSLRVSMIPGVRVQIARSINGGDIDWAVGAAVVHFLQTGMGQKANMLEVEWSSHWLNIRLVIVIVAVGLFGSARFFLGARFSRKVAAVGSAIRATTLGRGGWIEVATKTEWNRSTS